MKSFKQNFALMFIAGLMFFGVAFQANAQNKLTGTYQIDESKSDNVNEIANSAINSGNVQNRDQSLQDLQDKLESPENLAIEVRGNQAVLASSLSQQITLSADGSDQTQTLSDGSTIRLRANLKGDILTVSKLGSNEDYTVTFTSIDNGRSLKVSRRVTTDYLSETVFAESVYTKTDAVAQLDIFNSGNNGSTDNSSANNTVIGNDPTNNNPNTTTNNYPTSNPTNNGGNSPTTRTTGRTAPNVTINPNGRYIVANGEIITATLDSMISTKISQNNDRFKVTVTGPSQYRGAVIEGYISGIERSSRNPIGKSKLTLNFEKIYLTNGESYDFAGFLQSVTNTRGKSVKVDEEGVIQKTQTGETLKRAGIGAGAGAILGAIIGGAKGAVIGATIGAGGGAGSVAIQNAGDVELESGSAITVQASAPTK